MFPVGQSGPGPVGPPSMNNQGWTQQEVKQPMVVASDRSAEPKNNSNSIGLGINLGTVIGGPSSSHSSGGTGSPLSDPNWKVENGNGGTSGEASPPGNGTTIIEGNGGNGATTLLGMSDLGIGFNNSSSQAPGVPTPPEGTKSISPIEAPIFFLPKKTKYWQRRSSYSSACQSCPN